MELITRHLKSLFFVLGGMSICLQANGQQDCFDPIPLCSSYYTQNSGFSGTGAAMEVTANTTCLGNGEVNSTWYSFTIYQSGQLEFQLNPTNPNDDYDFALYNMTNDSCSGIAASVSQPVSCNYSADTGPTGLSPVGSGNQNGTSGSNQNAPISVTAGESFVLMVSNFTASQNGYELTFSGSASMEDNSAGVIDSISLQGQCNPNKVKMYLSDAVDCGSIAGNGSDFSISGPGNLSVIAASGLGCAEGAREIWLTFSSSLPQTGVYTVSMNTGSDGNSLLDACGNETAVSVSSQFTVVALGPEITITNIVSSDCGQSNGSATANVTGGSPPYTYNWNSSPGQTTPIATDLEPGTYRVAVTDANGCTATELVTIDNNNPLDMSNISFGPVSCHGLSDGSAQIIPTGGTGNFSIEWASNPTQYGQTATNLPSGPVAVSVIDDSGCEETVTINIPQPAPINILISPTNPDCGQANGSATVNPTGGNGGFSFAWNTNPVQNTATATNLSAGVYSLTVTDQNGCTASSNVILADNFAPNATIENRISDCGQGVGQATALATSGTAPYKYTWSTTPPQHMATATGLSEGDYFVTITDANSCVQIINVKIDSVPPPSLSTSVTQPNCGQADGEIEATVSNGVEPFVFTWSSSSNSSAVETGLAEGVYTVVVEDSIGCVESVDVELIQLPPESEITATDVCFGEETSFSFTTNSGATSWLWDFGNGQTSTDQNPSITYGNSGEFNVILYLTGGCLNDTVIDTTLVFEPANAAFTYEPEIPTTRTDIQFVYNGSGATDFLWDFGNGELGSGIRPSQLFGEEGTYDVTLITTDANGCSDTITQTIEVLLQPVIYFPNAIFPNGTQPNRNFHGFGIGVVDAEIQVFDRWGTLLYTSENLTEVMNSGWDGTYNGKPVKQGAYPYKVTASFYNGSSFEKLGTVTVIR